MSGHPPEPESLKNALGAAAAMRSEGDDPRQVARWLLAVHARCELLEDLLQVADRYLRFGMPEHELSGMRVLVDRLRERELTDERSDEVDSTLPL